MSRLGLVKAARSVDPAVVALVLVALGGAMLYARSSASPARTVRVLDGEVKASLPAGWTHEETEGIFVAQRPSLGELTPTLTVQRLEPPADDEADWLDVTLARMESERAATGFGFRVLSTEDRRAFGGHPTSIVRYAIVRDPPDSAPGDAVIPVVIGGVDALVRPEGGAPFRVSAWDREERFEDEASEISSALAGIEVSP